MTIELTADTPDQTCRATGSWVDFASGNQYGGVCLGTPWPWWLAVRRSGVVTLSFVLGVTAEPLPGPRPGPGNTTEAPIHTQLCGAGYNNHNRLCSLDCPSLQCYICTLLYFHRNFCDMVDTGICDTVDILIWDTESCDTVETPFCDIRMWY